MVSQWYEYRVGGDDATVRIWDATTGKTLLTLQGHIAPMRVVAWSLDGRSLASASHDGTVQVWEALKGKLLLTYRDHYGVVGSVAWSPRGDQLASASYKVRIWQAI